MKNELQLPFHRITIVLQITFKCQQYSYSLIENEPLQSFFFYLDAELERMHNWRPTVPLI